MYELLRLGTPAVPSSVTWRKRRGPGSEHHGGMWTDCCSGWSSVSSVGFRREDVKMCQDQHVDAISAASTCRYFPMPGNCSRLLEENHSAARVRKKCSSFFLFYFRRDAAGSPEHNNNLCSVVFASFLLFFFDGIIYFELNVTVSAQRHRVSCKAVWIAWIKRGEKLTKKLLYDAFGRMNNKKCLNSVWQYWLKAHTLKIFTLGTVVMRIQGEKTSLYHSERYGQSEADAEAEDVPVHTEACVRLQPTCIDFATLGQMAQKAAKKKMQNRTK